MSATGRLLTRIGAAAALTLPLTLPLGAGAVTSPIPPAVTRYLTLPHGRIAYDDTGGSGPLVLAIPGMGDLRHEYRALRPLLWRAGYRVVTMDIRGHGESSVAWDDYSAYAIGHDALALIAHLQAGPAVILGNSFAAGSALWAAHEGPASVTGVVLLGPVVRDGEPPWWARAAVAVGFAGPWRTAFWLAFWDSLFPLRKPDDHAQAHAAQRVATHGVLSPGHVGEVDVGLVDAAVLDLRRDLGHRRLEQSRVATVLVEVGRQQHHLGRERRGLHEAHARMHTQRPCLVRGGRDDTPSRVLDQPSVTAGAVGQQLGLMPVAAADHHRLTAQVRVAQQLHRRVEGVHVEVGDVAGHGNGAGTAAGTVSPRRGAQCVSRVSRRSRGLCTPPPPTFSTWV